MRHQPPCLFDTPPRRPVLVVLHQETSTPGRVGNALRALGYPLEVRRPRFGDPLPATLEDHAAAVIFGGPMSANDADDFVHQEIDWIAVPLKEQRPFLGICLGAQMLARQLGAKVAPHPDGRAQIGYYPVYPTPAGRAVCPDWPDHVYHWHREGFELPCGSELLAQGSDFPNEAFRFGDAFGLQFHPDVTYAMMHRWTTRGDARFDLPGARPRHHHFADRAVHDVIERAWLQAFLQSWLGMSAVAGFEIAMAQAAE
jgi:GMP synthase (glutamine-hydrolysing)